MSIKTPQCRGRLARVFQRHSPSHARPANRVAGVSPAFSNHTARPTPVPPRASLPVPIASPPLFTPRQSSFPKNPIQTRVPPRHSERSQGISSKNRREPATTPNTTNERRDTNLSFPHYQFAIQRLTSQAVETRQPFHRIVDVFVGHST